MASESVSRSGALPRIGRSELRLLLVSFLSLYFELTLIRWIPTQVRLVAYFTNFVLIAALLGLGLGMLLAARRLTLGPLFPLGLLLLTGTVVLLERHNFYLPIVATGMLVWNYVHDLPLLGVVSYLVLVGFFLVMVGTFALIGQEVGRALQTLPALAAYSWNILGSLLGVLGFALLNSLDTSPTVWFAVGAVGFGLYLLLILPHPGRFVLAALPLLGTVGIVYFDTANPPGGVASSWSPYYRIQVGPKIVQHRKVGYVLSVNQDAFQYAFDLSGRFRSMPFMAGRAHQYNLPFTFVRAKHVLVMGAGTGNDVAAALRNSRTSTVDAVEIDPLIASLGRKIHPEHPYQNPRVHLHVTDARSFLQQTSQKYNLIVFGKLDSHRVFSHMSSVRMDNYIYTRENFETVRRHLAPGGITVVGFVVTKPWIADRLFTLLDTVFGHPPLVYQTSRFGYDTLFIVGNKPLAVPAGAPRITHQQFVHDVLAPQGNWRYTNVQGFLSPRDLSGDRTLLTDDWPYLYMQGHEIPPNYLIVLVLTILVSVMLVWLTVPSIDLRRLENWNFFLLGAGFALQETKGITDIALLFGSTWITNIIVISAILLVILLANLVVSRWGDIPLPWVYAALFLLLISNYFVPLRGLLEYGFWIQVVASGIRVAAPLFFSGIIFARLFQRAESTSSALGANLMGAVVGGLAEYSSLALGLKQLYLIALVFYVLSFVIAVGPQLRGLGLRRPALGSVRGR